MRRMLLVVAVLALLCGTAGCMAPVTVQEAQALNVTAWQGHLGNDQRIEQAWEQVYASARQADIDYSTQKATDLVKMAAKTPADIEEGVKAIIVQRDKAMADTQIIIAKMRGLVAINQSEAAKIQRLGGTVSEWMGTGMDASAVPNLVNEAFNIMQTLGLKISAPGIQVPTILPPASAAPAN